MNVDNRKIPFRAGMMFKSNTHPQFDCMIDFVLFRYDEDNCKLENIPQIIKWHITNTKIFDSFCDEHCKSVYSTFPYVVYGECNIKSFKARIKKYNLEFIGMSEKETIIYQNDDGEFSEGMRK